MWDSLTVRPTRCLARPVEAFALKPLPVLAQTLRLQLVEAFTPKPLHPQSLCQIHRLPADRAADQMLINACAVRTQMPR